MRHCALRIKRIRNGTKRKTETVSVDARKLSPHFAAWKPDPEVRIWNLTHIGTGLKVRAYRFLSNCQRAAKDLEKVDGINWGFTNEKSYRDTPRDVMETAADIVRRYDD